MKKNKLIFPLGEKEQEVLIGENILENLPKYLYDKGYSRVLFFIDEITFKKHNKKFKKLIRETKVPCDLIKFYTHKEKSTATLFRVLDYCVDKNIDRKSCIVGIGGGRIGDIAGFAASIYMRGVDFIQVGTTLMSQADCVIGKTAIDYLGRKNVLGNFNSPVLSICDVSFLKTNPEDFIRMGMVEILKHSFLSGDEFVSRMSDVLNKGFLELPFEELIYSSLLVKGDCVIKDYWDKKGEHALLSYGHTLANAFEEISGYGMRHGEAVALGMIGAALYAEEIGEIDSEMCERHNDLIKKIIDIKLPRGMNVEKIIKILLRDKNSINKIPRMLILSRSFGKSKMIEIKSKVIKKVLKKIIE